MGYLPQIADAGPGFGGGPSPGPGAGGGGNLAGPTGPLGGPAPAPGVPGMIGGPTFADLFLNDIFRVIDSLREFAPSLQQGAAGLKQLQEVSPSGAFDNISQGSPADPMVQTEIGNMIQSYFTKNPAVLGNDPYNYKRTQAMEKAALALANQSSTVRGPVSLRPDSVPGQILQNFSAGTAGMKPNQNVVSGYGP